MCTQCNAQKSPAAADATVRADAARALNVMMADPMPPADAAKVVEDLIDALAPPKNDIISKAKRWASDAKRWTSDAICFVTFSKICP